MESNSNSSGVAIIIGIFLLLLIAAGAGVYFINKTSTVTTSDASPDGTSNTSTSSNVTSDNCSNLIGTANVQTYIFSNNACVPSNCMTGYGIDASGTPSPSGMCFTYVQSSPIPDCSLISGASSNVQTYTLQNNTCVPSQCMSGYGIDASGTPTSDGTCFTYPPPMTPVQIQQAAQAIGTSAVGIGVLIARAAAQADCSKLYGKASNVQTYTLQNNTCVPTKCMTGYGTDISGMPTSSGLCLKYIPVEVQQAVQSLGKSLVGIGASIAQAAQTAAQNKAIQIQTMQNNFAAKQKAEVEQIINGLQQQTIALQAIQRSLPINEQTAFQVKVAQVRAVQAQQLTVFNAKQAQELAAFNTMIAAFSRA